ncbi:MULTISPECIES: helix-turn-helix transcriptional regulator [Methylobacter]
MIGNRLKSERERLDLTQPAFAEVAGAKKRTVIDWEKGVSSPTAVQLSALSAIGIDVQFVLTGVRSLNMPNDPRNTAQQLYLVKSSTEAIVPLKLDKYRAADLQNILCAVARGNSHAVSEAMADYANSELTVAEKDLLAAYRAAAQPDKAFMDRLAQLTANAAEPGEDVNIEGEKHE